MSEGIIFIGAGSYVVIHVHLLSTCRLTTVSYDLQSDEAPRSYEGYEDTELCIKDLSPSDSENCVSTDMTKVKTGLLKPYHAVM